MKPTDLVRADIATMEPYTPIFPFEVLAARLGRSPEHIIKLDANENPYGPSPRCARPYRTCSTSISTPTPKADS